MSASHDERVREREEAATIRWNLYISILLIILMKAVVIEENGKIDR
jgi:hypothetical protein